MCRCLNVCGATLLEPKQLQNLAASWASVYPLKVAALEPYSGGVKVHGPCFSLPGLLRTISGCRGPRNNYVSSLLYRSDRALLAESMLLDKAMQIAVLNIVDCAEIRRSRMLQQ